jgi:hypothetical protein
MNISNYGDMKMTDEEAGRSLFQEETEENEGTPNAADTRTGAIIGIVTACCVPEAISQPRLFP